MGEWVGVVVVGLMVVVVGFVCGGGGGVVAVFSGRWLGGWAGGCGVYGWVGWGGEGYSAWGDVVGVGGRGRDAHPGPEGISE